MLLKLRSLLTHSAVYGLGDVATSLLSFLLLPIYVRFLSPADYGVIGLLLTVEVVSKIVFRWGLDAAFMRLWFDCDDRDAQVRLSSTIFWFMVIANGTLLVAALVAAPAIAGHLFGDAGQTGVLQLVLFNTFVTGFHYLPFHVLRIQRRTRRFTALSVSRSAATLILRLVLVVGAGLGVLGIVLADTVVTLGFTFILGWWFAPMIRLVFSRRVLREALRFGLPRLPHGVAHQVIAVSDRYLLTHFVPLREIGLYTMGATFGLAPKFALSAFEFAWAPFYFATMRELDAPRTFSRVTTYIAAGLVLVCTGTAAVAYDIVRLMTTPEFHGAAAVVPWIALAVLCQGIYNLTSIGLNITKRTEFYAVSTMVAAAVSVGTNLILVPRFGAIGAAAASAVAYAVLAGTALVFSQHFYPIDYEAGRLARCVVAGVAGWLLAALFPLEGLHAALALLIHGVIVVLIFFGVLAFTGFLRPGEAALVRRTIEATLARARAAAGAAPPPTPSEMYEEATTPLVESVELAGEILPATPPDAVPSPERSAASGGNP